MSRTRRTERRVTTRCPVNRVTIQKLESHVLSKQILDLNHWADVLHGWHRITLNRLTSLQIEKGHALCALDHK